VGDGSRSLSLFSRKKKYFAACEYWVYLPTETMPEQDGVMTRMVGQSPYRAIGKREGIIFSDIRLSVSLVLRSKNPHVFRPDLLKDSVEPTADLLTALSKSQALVKVRYISEEPLSDDRHVTFMAHMAAAYLDLGEGLVVYDVVSEALFMPEGFREALQNDSAATGFDMHVRVLWQKALHSGFAETKGLLKKGLPELKTDDAYLDQQVLVCEVLEQAARKVWEMPEIPQSVDVAAYEDTYKVEIFPSRTGPYRVRILRVFSPQA